MSKCVGVFATNSYTEIALEDFLLKIRDKNYINWDLRIPQARNFETGGLLKAPKIAIIEESAWKPFDINGQTGADLIELVVEFFRINPDYLDFYFAILIEDDLDNRKEDIESIKVRLHQQIKKALPNKFIPPIYVLLAAPEIESWFIADWESSFGRVLLADISTKFFTFVKTSMLDPLDGNIEKYSGDKLSDRLIRELDKIVIDMGLSDEVLNNQYYSCCYRKEREKTQKMLASIHPEIVARMCTVYFAPTYNLLKAL